VTKYYMAGASKVAMRKYIIPVSNTLTYLFGDHLGSTSLSVDASTGETIETRYKPWGEVRYTTPSKTLPTRYTFTSQYSYMSDEATDLGSAGFGLLFYNARFYDPAIGRFISADSIIPGGVQGLDRYAYVNNSPVNFTDPSGHSASYCNQISSTSGQAACNSATRSQEEKEQEIITLYIIPKLKEFGATLSVEEGTNANWSASNAYYALSAVRTIGGQISETLGNGSSSSEAFKSVYHTGVNFMWMPRTCAINGYTCWGYAGNFSETNNTIQIYEKYTTSNGYTLTSPITPQLFVHELGHALNILSGRRPQNYVHNYNGGILTESRRGFATGYTFGQDNLSSEIFADMFVGWAYSKWRNDPLGPIRNDVMTTNMGEWIVQAQTNGW